MVGCAEREKFKDDAYSDIREGLNLSKRQSRRPFLGSLKGGRLEDRPPEERLPQAQGQRAPRHHQEVFLRQDDIRLTGLPSLARNSFLVIGPRGVASPYAVSVSW